MQRWGLGLLAFALVIAGAVWLFKIWPTAFVPQEDQGYLFVRLFLARRGEPGPHRRRGTARRPTFMNSSPAVANVTEVDGYSLIDSQNKTNNGVLFVSLKDYEQRKSAALQAPAVIAGGEEGLRQRSRRDWSCRSTRPRSRASASPPASRCGSSRKGGGNYAQLANVVQRNRRESADARPSWRGVNTTISATNQQLLADVDREKAEVLGVAVQEVYNTLQTMFGSLYVSQFPKDSRLWQVILQAEPQYRMTPEDIGRFYVQEPRRQDGTAVRSGDDPLRQRPGPGDALQQLPGGADHRCRPAPASAPASRSQRFGRSPKK